MAEASGKSGKPTISSIAAPTADIDDEWALDDEAAAAPVAQSPSGQAAVDAQASASPPTEEIDSEWPDDAVKADQNADQLRKPKIPQAPKLPEEAAGLERQSSSAPAVSDIATPSAPSDRPSERTIDAFERAAASTGRGAFGIRSSAPPAPASTPQASAPPASTAQASTPPEADAVVAAAAAPVEVRANAETVTTPDVATSTAPVTRATSARPASSAPPPASRPAEARESEPPASKSKKGPMIGYGLAAAAVAVVGLGLTLRSPSAPDRAIEQKVDPAPAKPAAASLPHAEAPSAPEPSAAAPITSTAAETSAGETPDTHKAKGSEETGAEGEGEGASDTKTSPEASAPAAAADGGAPILVTVHIYPPEAEIYHKGKRLGRSGQQIEVVPGERKLLVLIRDGYWPRKLVLDGKETTYNIGLRKMPEGATAGATPAPATPKFTPPAP